MKKKIITFIFILTWLGGVIQLFQQGITPFIVGYSVFIIILSSSILIGAYISNSRRESRGSNHDARRGSW
jgi:glycerol uptake facilitator-like aquaporin